MCDVYYGRDAGPVESRRGAADWSPIVFPGSPGEEVLEVDAQMATIAVRSPDVSVLGPPTYANVTHVSFTPYDFRITFSLLPSSREAPGAVVPEPPQAVAEIIMPSAAVESLMEVLRTEFDRFVGEFGPPRPTVHQSS